MRISNQTVAICREKTKIYEHFFGEKPRPVLIYRDYGIKRVNSNSELSCGFAAERIRKQLRINLR
jgi:hypothetical protein